MSGEGHAIFGTKGEGHELGFAGMPFIKGANAWRYKGPRPYMYQVEHDEMFAAIRAGNPINDGVRLQQMCGSCSPLNISIRRTVPMRRLSVISPGGAF